MGGVAKAVNTVAQAVAKPMVDIPLALPRAAVDLTKGNSILGSVKTGIAPLVRDITAPGEDKIVGPGSTTLDFTGSSHSGVNNGTTGFLAANKTPDINPIVAEDPAAVAAKAKLEKERARRQSEIDILTGQPGRGGTIAPKNYSIVS